MRLDLSAPHTGFVIASYLVSAAAISGLVIATLARLRARERKLADLQMLGKGRGDSDHEQ
jgi:heme exporter protein CcmD